MLPRHHCSSPAVLAYYSNLIVNYRPSADAVWIVASLEFVATALVPFLFAAEHGVVGFSCFDQRMGTGACGVIVPLATGVLRRMNHYGLASFVLACPFDSALAYLAF